jgi:hypothetical protein
MEAAAGRRHVSRACLTPPFLLSDGRAAGALRCIHQTSSEAFVRRPFVLASCLCATVLAIYSCSRHASVTTDGDGHIVELSSVRVESSLARVGVAMLVAGGQIALELRWLRRLSATTGEASGG